MASGADTHTYSNVREQNDFKKPGARAWFNKCTSCGKHTCMQSMSKLGGLRVCTLRKKFKIVFSEIESESILT